MSRKSTSGWALLVVVNNRVAHALGCSRIANEIVAVAFFAKAVPMLLAELAADELTQGADELCETSQASAYSLDLTP